MTKPRTERTWRGAWTRRFVWAVAALIAGGAGASLLFAGADTTMPTAGRKLIRVPVAQVAAVDGYELGRAYTGEVVAGRTSELGFERLGLVVQVAVDDGDRVEAGDVLARLDTRHLDTARAEATGRLDAARALLEELEAGPRKERIAAQRAAVEDLEEQLALARRNRDRRERAFEGRAVTWEQVDVAVQAARALDARVASARAILDELLNGTRKERVAAQRAVVAQLAARVASIDVDLAKSRLVAPYAATVAHRHLDEGTVAAPGEPVLRVVELDVLELRVGLPPRAAASLRAGETLPVVVNGRKLDAVVDSILPEIEEATRTLTVVLAIEGEAARGLGPGMTARLRLTRRVVGSGIWVPVSALAKAPRGLWSLYVVRPQEAAGDGVHRVERREVEVVHTDGERALVRGALEAGDRVIEGGTHRVVPGQWVLPTDGS